MGSIFSFYEYKKINHARFYTLDPSVNTTFERCVIFTGPFNQRVQTEIMIAHNDTLCLEDDPPSGLPTCPPGHVDDFFVLFFNSFPVLCSVQPEWKLSHWSAVLIMSEYLAWFLGSRSAPLWLRRWSRRSSSGTSRCDAAASSSRPGWRENPAGRHGGDRI